MNGAASTNISDVLVSIVTVTRNCVDTIERTLESVAKSKGPQIEYIVVDGASDDGTLERLAEYDDVIDHLVSGPDKGIYDAMNKGMQCAHGEYTLYLNGDDHLIPGAFEAAIMQLVVQQPDVYSFASRAIGENGESLPDLVPSLWKLPIFNTIPHLSTFVKTSLLKEYQFRDKYRIAADYDLFLRLYRAKQEFRLSGDVIAVHYRGGFSANTKLVKQETLEIRQQTLGPWLYAFFRAVELLNQVRRRFI